MCSYFTFTYVASYLITPIIIVAAKIVETKVHKILGKDLTVELKKPKPKASGLTDHKKAAILINNVADTISDDLLFLYIDNITELDGESRDYIISRCDNLQVIITFNDSVDLPVGGTYVNTIII